MTNLIDTLQSVLMTAAPYTVQEMFGSLTTYLDYAVFAIQIAGIFVVIRGLINLSTALTSTDNPSVRNSLLDVACGLIMYNIVLVLNLTGLSY